MVQKLMVSDNYSPKFTNAKINGKILPTINDKKLIEMGIEHANGSITTHKAYEWDVEQVSEWVQKLKLSDDYSKQFIDAKINGSNISTIDDKKLTHMGIINDSDKKEIIKKIEILCQTTSTKT